MEKAKNFYMKYRHGIPLVLYGILYMTWFCYLERTVTKHYHVIHMAIDDHIPFCEVFIIPYFLWFLYVSAVVLYLFFRSKPDYWKACIFLFTGMTIFLLVSTLWPNGHHLRPYALPRDNIFTRMVTHLWRTDTPTNLWPSIHVYNSIGAHVALCRCRLGKKRWLRNSSLVLCVSIILSTMFLKQHSCVDVILGIALGACMNQFVYESDVLVKAHDLVGKLVRNHRDLPAAFPRKIHGTAKDAEV